MGKEPVGIDAFINRQICNSDYHLSVRLYNRSICACRGVQHLDEVIADCALAQRISQHDSMGDGLLAIFPLGDKGEAAQAEFAKRALDSIRAAHKALAEAGDHVEFRSSLHVGKLHYGNMGGSRRLDFTAIGPSVNLTARLLGAASELGRDDVMSEAFALQLNGAAERIGEIDLKGFPDKQAVFALA